MGQHDKFFDYLFLMKDLEKEQDRNEVIHKLQSEADSQLER